MFDPEGVPIDPDLLALAGFLLLGKGKQVRINRTPLGIEHKLFWKLVWRLVRLILFLVLFFVLVLLVIIFLVLVLIKIVFWRWWLRWLWGLWGHLLLWILHKNCSWHDCEFH